MAYVSVAGFLVASTLAALLVHRLVEEPVAYLMRMSLKGWKVRPAFEGLSGNRILDQSITGFDPERTSQRLTRSHHRRGRGSTAEWSSRAPRRRGSPCSFRQPRFTQAHLEMLEILWPVRTQHVLEI